MAIPTNTRETYGAIGIREDLSNIIYNISPTETPFLSGCGRETAENTYFEWQTDALTAAAANRATEGNDPTSVAVSEPTRVGNYTQISVKAVQTSGTAEAVNFAGRKSSQAYQLAKRAKEMKRDMEKMLMDNVAQSAGAGPSPGPATARATAGLGAWVATNYHTLGGAPSPPGLGSASSGNGTDTASDATSTGTLTTNDFPAILPESSISLSRNNVIGIRFNSPSKNISIGVGSTSLSRYISIPSTKLLSKQFNVILLSVLS